MILDNQIEGPIFTTPETVISSMRRVNTDLESVDAEFKANVGVLDMSFVGSWGTFVAEWRAFYAKNQSTAGMLVTGTMTVMRQTEDYSARVVAWRASLAVQPGVKLLSPAPTALANPSASGVDWTGLATAGAVVVASIAVIWGLVELAPVLGLVKKRRRKDRDRDE